MPKFFDWKKWVADQVTQHNEALDKSLELVTENDRLKVQNTELQRQIKELLALNINLSKKKSHKKAEKSEPDRKGDLEVLPHIPASK